MDLAIVERGCNVVSSSRDGTARLWDCGKSACLAKYAAESIINGCSLHVPAASIDLLQPDHVPGMVFTVMMITLGIFHIRTEMQFALNTSSSAIRDELTPSSTSLTLTRCHYST